MSGTLKQNPIEVCMCVYQRYYRLPIIVKKLNEQTIQNFNLNIWNNTDKDLTSFLKDFPADRLQVLGDGTNHGSASRFKIVPKTTGSCIIFIDDDETPAPQFVEYMYKMYQLLGKNTISGWYTRNFVNDFYTQSFNDPPPKSEVDYIGTGGMVLDREIFDKEPLLQNIPLPFDKTEDLYLCYLARMKYEMHLIKLDEFISIEVDGKDQFANIDKDDIWLRLRSQRWQLVRDMILKEYAYQNLKDFQEVMNKLEIPFWVAEGLLLGLYRDKDMILSDEDDIDVGVWKEYANRSPEIIEALKAKHFKVLNNWQMDGTLEGIAVYRNGNKIDIIFTRKNKDNVYFLARNFGNMGSLPYFAFVFPKEIFNEFSTIKWLNLELPCPKNIEGYLTARYGNWQIRKMRNIDYHADNFEDNPCYKINWDYKQYE